MSFAALFLARSPEHRRQLVADPKLIPKAVDELLRRFPIVNQGRCVREDMVYKGVSMKAGEMIIMPTTLHGLDERAFADPLKVDFNRPTPMHSTFGNGPHRCPGSNLGRTELRGVHGRMAATHSGVRAAARRQDRDALGREWHSLRSAARLGYRVSTVPAPVAVSDERLRTESLSSISIRKDVHCSTIHIAER